MAALACTLGLASLAPLLARAEGRGDLQDRLELAALLQTINANILASTSATLTLEDWCARLGLADDPTVTVDFLPGGEPPALATRRLLEVGADEAVGHRRVQLVCGDVVLSEADNWYVPGRLTADMNRVLDTSDTSFGKVIRPLDPARRTIGMEVLWHPLPAGWERLDDHELRDLSVAEPPLAYDPATPLFEHQALVMSGQDDALPLAYVRETYRMALIGPGFD